MRYKLAENIIDESDVAALAGWLTNSWQTPQLTKGRLTLEFERQWAKWIGTKYAVFCNSGSSANLLMAAAALYSGGLKNKKVVVPAVGWATTVSPFMQLGFDPIMCGADPDNFGLNLDHLEKILKKHKPALVIMVQVLGVPSDMKKLLALKKKYKFLLMEDACAALGAEYGGRKVGSFGDMGAFSFYFGHQLSTIEGGMVNTNSKNLYDLLLMLRSHGWGKDLDKPTRARFLKKYKIDSFHEPFTFFVPGFNLRSTDLQAFLGILQMRKADKVSAIRARNHLLYAKNIRGVEFQKWPAGSRPVSISFGALAKNEAHRKRVVNAFNKYGIETRLFSAGNLGRHPFWFERYGKFSDPVADKIHSSGFFLPNHESLTAKDVLFICGIVNKIS